MTIHELSHPLLMPEVFSIVSNHFDEKMLIRASAVCTTWKNCLREEREAKIDGIVYSKNIADIFHEAGISLIKLPVLETTSLTTGMLEHNGGALVAPVESMSAPMMKFRAYADRRPGVAMRLVRTDPNTGRKELTMTISSVVEQHRGSGEMFLRHLWTGEDVASVICQLRTQWVAQGSIGECPVDWNGSLTDASYKKLLAGQLPNWSVE